MVTASAPVTDTAGTYRNFLENYVSWDEDSTWSNNWYKYREGLGAENESSRSTRRYRAAKRSRRMTLTRISLVLAAVLGTLCSSAFLPGEYSPHIDTQEGSRDEELPLEARGRCPGKRKRRLTTMTVDTSLIDTSYLDSLVQMEDMHTRSLSPWDYSLNTDPNRFPFVIAEANCLTFTCVDADGNDNPDLISFPVQQEVMVLRRERKGCSFSYRLETEEVTLGCTCIRPIVSYY